MLQFCTVIVPYALIQYYPLLYLLGRTTSLWNMVMPLFAVIFLIPCYVLWRVGVRHYKSSGSCECNDRHEVHTIEAAAELGFGSIEYELVTIE